MIIYFNGFTPFALFLNGKYYETFYDKPLIYDICKKDLYVIAKPLDAKFKDVSLVIDGSAPQTKCENCYITDLKGGYFMSFFFSPCFTDYKVICQKKDNNFIATLYSDNGYKLSIETPSDFFVKSIPFTVENADVVLRYYNNFKLLFICLEYDGKKMLDVYDLSNEIRHVFMQEICEYEFNNNLFLTQENNILRCKIKSEWEYNGKSFSQKYCDAVYSGQTFYSDKNYIAVCFFESLRLGLDVKNYCTEDIYSNLNNLYEYLGDYIGVINSPSVIKRKGVGLIYKTCENNFTVKYADSEFYDGKISNVILIDE